MRRTLANIITEVEKVISGKRDVIESILISLLAEGHVLLDDRPGVGKTTLAVALCRAMGLTFRRVQFTPDVLPSDLNGFTMYDKASGGFVYRPGVIAQANLLLGDEINRAASKTQSALLEAMGEGQVTVDGETHILQKPFWVIATQNSVGAVGTSLLPYAQIDRFLMRLSIGFPDADALMTMLRARQDEDPLDSVKCVATSEDIRRMQLEAKGVTARDAILDYIVRLTIETRDHEDLEAGLSPRGALFLLRAAKARAYFEDRDYVTGADVQAVYHDVCDHRVLLTEKAQREGKTARAALDAALRKTDSPDRRAGGLMRR